MEFSKKDKIKVKDLFYECIVGDENTAVFGEIVIWNEKEKRVSYENIFIVDQKHQDNFDYELVSSKTIRVVPDSDGSL